MKINTYACLCRYRCAFGEWQSFNGFNHKVSREVTANQTNHLMVVEAGDDVVVRGAVEHFPDLLQETLSVQLSRRSERVFAQKDVLALQSCAETEKRKKEKRLEILRS